MQTHELIIEAKVKRSQFSIVAAEDFQTRVGQPVNPRMVLEQPNITLYCLDHANQHAIFVETSPDIDLLREPFYFIAQYEAAQRLIAVPYETLHALANDVNINPQRIILFYSTGRCGSTLLSHILNLNPATVSYSEPDLFSQLVQLHTAKQSSDEETATLLRDSAMIMSANAQQQGFEFYAFKFRSYVLSVGNLLYHLLPQAKIIFMYRHALTWARSFSRAFGAPTDADLQVGLNQNKFRYLTPSVHAYMEAHSTPLGWVEYIAHMWVSTMQDIRWLQQQEATVACARFEDLKATPEAVINLLLSHCELPMPEPNLLAEVLAKDSQAGTKGAQDKKVPSRQLSDADLVNLERFIHELDPTLVPDTVL